MQLQEEQKQKKLITICSTFLKTECNTVLLDRTDGHCNPFWQWAYITSPVALLLQCIFKSDTIY